jgi:hypothetical protein
MSILLSDDLRQALDVEGAPLKLVDPATGELYILVSAAAYEKAHALPPEQEALLQHAQISNTRLLELARRNPPPQAWLEGDEADLF